MRGKFPGFFVGGAVSASQCEGAYDVGGKGLSTATSYREENADSFAAIRQASLGDCL